MAGFYVSIDDIPPSDMYSDRVFHPGDALATILDVIIYYLPLLIKIFQSLKGYRLIDENFMLGWCIDNMSLI